MQVSFPCMLPQADAHIALQLSCVCTVRQELQNTVGFRQPTVQLHANDACPEAPAL